MRRNLPLLAALLLAAAMVVGQLLPAGPAGAALNPALDPDVRATQTAAATARLDGVMHPLRPGEKPPQFVIFSFDGAGSHTHWQRVMDIAARSQASVTGFLSGIYLLDDAQKGRYRGPGHARGKASIGFGGPPAQVATLVDDLNAARASGHEIGTHYNGHFCHGAEPSVGTWSTAAWDGELDQFFSFVAGARGLQLDPATIRGGRTPCLEGNPDALFPALRVHGMTYDSSRTSTGVAWPEDRDGIREFPMPVVRVPALGRKVILMDYNLWYAFDGAREAPQRTEEFTDESLVTYRAVYDAALTGNRAPLVVGNHFNDWNGGAFSTAVERFMGEVCLKPETVCTTYGNVSRWMDMQDPAVLATWRAMPHAQVPASFG